MLANTGINIVPLLEMLGNTITVISDTVTQMYQYSDNNNPDNKLKGIVYAPNLETVESRSIDDNSGMTTIIMPKVKAFGLVMDLKRSLYLMLVHLLPLTHFLCVEI